MSIFMKKSLIFTVVAFASILILAYIYFINTAVKFTASTIYINPMDSSPDVAHLKSEFKISKEEEKTLRPIHRIINMYQLYLMLI